MALLILTGNNKPTDSVFSLDLDTGEITWNVTRLIRAAEQGRFGLPVEFDTDALPPPDYSTGYLERAKIDAMKRLPAVLDMPAIAIGMPAGNPRPMLCICDGQHRITARYELKLPKWRTFIVPYTMEKDYRIEFVGY